MDTETASIADLSADPANARMHNERNIDAIKASLRRFGQQKPIVVDGNNVVRAGNGTLQAAKALGWDEISVVRSELADVEMAAFAIADNRTAELAEWDAEALAKTLAALPDDVPAADVGFAVDDVQRLMEQMHADEGGADKAGPDPDLLQLPENPVTQTGDVWIMGDHRLMCGDCRSPDDVQAALAGTQINVAISSPPYASQRAYDETSEFMPVPADEYVDWFDAVQANIAGHLAEDGSWLLNIKEHCEDGQRHLYVKDLTLAHARRWGWLYVDEYCWVNGGTPKAPRQRFKNGWEPVFHFARGRHKFRPDSVMHPTGANLDWDGDHPNKEGEQGGGGSWGSVQKGIVGRRDVGQALGFKRNGQVVGAGSPSDEHRQGKPMPKSAPTVSRGQGVESQANRRMMGESITARAIEKARQVGSDGDLPDDMRLGLAYPSNVLQLGKNDEALGHPAAFPTSLPSFFIRAYSDEGDTVFDPFIGSGTTLIAADNEGRRCVGMDVSPAYCDIVVRRWERATGGEATREEGTK